MASSEREIFTFTWRIERFSFCAQPIDKRITSPIFVVNFLKCEWYLWVCPRVYGKDNDPVTCSLQRLKSPSQKIAIGFAITVFSVAGKEIITRTCENHVFRKCGDGYFLNLCTREDIFHVPEGQLSNDTLTLKCEMWKIDDGSNGGDLLNAEDDFPDAEIAGSILVRQMYASVVTDDTVDMQNQLGYNQCAAVTRIEIGNKSILWPIKRFNELRPKKKLSIYVPTSLQITPSFSLTLYVSEEEAEFQNVQIEIRIKSDRSTEYYFVKCKIVAFHPLSRIRFEKADDHLFIPGTKKEIWKFPGFINGKKFKNDCFNSSQDILYLRCEFAFSIPGAKTVIEKTRILPISSETLVSKDNNFFGLVCKKLWNNEKFSDLVIRTGDYEFKAHKMVLAVQSTVFNAMFESDMVENQNGVVDIKDVEKDILDLMLRFMYGADFKIAKRVDAERLYSAADKYEILPLKFLCSRYLNTNLSVSNACSVLVLAHLHQDCDLMEEVKCFIRLHAREIFCSGAWTELMRSNVQLAADTMHSILMN